MAVKPLQKAARAYKPSDLCTLELAAKVPTEINRSTDGKKQRRVLVQIPLDYYHRMVRGGITRRQWEAGDRLYSYYVRAAFKGSGTANLSGVFVQRASGDRVRTDSQQEAYTTFYSALNSLGTSSVAREIIYKVCCEGVYLKDISVGYYASANQLMPRLKEALDCLADFFNIPD